MRHVKGLFQNPLLLKENYGLHGPKNVWIF